MIARPLGLLAAAAAVAAAGLLADRGGATGTAADAPLDGAQVFHAKGCATCHDGPGWDTPMSVAPSLDGAAEWAGSRIPGTAAEDYVRQSIVAPQSFISPRAEEPGFLMPAIALSPEELDALVDHLLPRR